MSTATKRPRIPTLNELVGSKQIPEDVGGAWIVYAPAGHVTCVTDNLDAAETAIYYKAEESGLDPKDFRIEVWAIQRFYEGDPDRVQKVLDWVGRGYGSRAWGAEQLNISEYEFSESYGEQLDKMVLVMRRKPYRPHRHEFRVCRFRRESIWQRIKRTVHEHSPRIDLDLLP